MKILPLKYLGYSVTFQEVPNEISLIINISGCPHKCEGCHSEYLWEYDGKFVSDDIYKIIKQYDGLISCVCFMGGDQNIKELNNYLRYIKSIGLKTCIYSGEGFDYFKDYLDNIDWLKCGKYIDELRCDNNIQYGIKLATSNQKIYKKGLDY